MDYDLQLGHIKQELLVIIIYDIIVTYKVVSH